MYQSFVFLEIRVLVVSNKKAFCNCETGIYSKNCPICTRSKGSYPILKDTIAHHAYTLAHSLNCSLIQKALYEYPTGTPIMPPEYQLCGASIKIAENGWLDIEFHKHKKRIAIPEIRIEEDAGKLVHTNQKTFMDFSTAGMPSIRIRTGNNLELGEEAEMFLTKLKNRMRYIGIITETPESNTIRCNAYTSLTVFPHEPHHYVKLRNLNSFNFVRQAINEDLRRQEELLKQGKELISESRLWNARQKRTEPYKLREFINHIPTAPIRELNYYTASDSFLTEVIRTVPENQSERMQRYVKMFGLSVPSARIICQDAKIADFFESTVKQANINPKHVADSLVSEVLILLKRANTTLQNISLQPEHFAQILGRFETGNITYASVRRFLQAVIVHNKAPAALLAQDEWKKISDQKTLKKLVHTMLAEHAKEAELLKTGVMKYLEILSGLIMKETGGRADQKLVKQLIKEELDINIIYILSMGETITDTTRQGTVKAGNVGILPQLLDDDLTEKYICFENVAPNGLLSEELEPADWAQLIHTICEKIVSGTANGIVLTHGTDTLVYTAPLLYWLFADTPVPIVLTTSTALPSLEPNEHNEARNNLNEAIRLAWKETNGIYVLFRGKVLSPLNLKFMGSTAGGFVNWNMKQPIFKGDGLLNDYEETDPFILESILHEAARSMFLIKTYPGITTEYLLAFLKKNISTFFLELYEKGTANMKESPYSLKEFLNRGKKQNCRFYCTSQQAENVDFSGYITARNIWKEGAVPMGMLTTETAIALYYAAALVCDTQEELNSIMENAGMLNDRGS